jgi:Ca-activated chloride channel family protein
MYEVELTGEAKDALATVRVRAKAPEGERANEQAFPVTASAMHPSFQEAPASFRLATAAAGFADALRGNSDVSYSELEAVAESCEGGDEDVSELRNLIHRAQKLTNRDLARR